MTEDQAIERILRAITPHCGQDVGGYVEPDPDEIAKAAWNEMKAIASETPPNPVPAWRTKAELTRESAAQCMRNITRLSGS